MISLNNNDEWRTENFEITGNFENDYLEACRKVGHKPLSCLKFGVPLPPLPRDDELSSVSLGASSVSLESNGIPRDVNVNAANEDDGAAPAEASQNLLLGNNMKPVFSTRRILSDRREVSIQEFLKKAQIDPEAESLFPSSNWTANRKPYYSRFKFTPTLDLEHSQDGDEGEPEYLYKIELRNYKIPLYHFEIINRLTPSMSNVINLTLWNCGLENSYFPAIASLISSGSIQQVAIERNPNISDIMFAQLLGEESNIRILSLRCNKIGDNGVKLIGAALKNNRSLVSLDLFDNRIKKLGAEGLGEGLKSNSTLQSLCLGKNEIGDEGILHLAKALMNIPLSPEEVHQRKKLLLVEMEKTKNDIAPVDDDLKKKGPKRAASGNLLGKASTNDKDKKKVPAAASTKKGVEPVPPKGNKTPDDPKTKKIAAGAEDKKGAKKPTAPPSTKGKKGKDEKDEVDENVDQATTIEPMFEHNNQWFILGNRALNNVNLSHNGITDNGVKFIFDAVVEQEHTAENAPEGLVGLFRLNLRYNLISNDNVYYPKLVDLLINRNPFHEATEDSEFSEEFDDMGEDVDGTEVA